MLRSKVLFLILFVFLGAHSGAQNFTGKVSGGILGSQISGDGYAGFDKASPIIGLAAFVTLRDSIQFESGLFYLQKGSRKAANPSKGDYTSYLLKLDYIEVPFLIRVPVKRKPYFLETGLGLGFLFNSYAGNQFGRFPSSDRESRAFNKTDLSFYLGAGYRFTPRFSISVRSSNSLLPVRAHASGGTFRLNLGQYNSLIIFQANYILQKANKTIH